MDDGCRAACHVGCRLKYDRIQALRQNSILSLLRIGTLRMLAIINDRLALSRGLRNIKIDGKK
jgi:hypothetical protein